VERVRERLRNVEGREGILAEERLYSTFDEELIIRHYFQDRRGGFYLDVGCAWPRRQSNTYYLEEHLGWTGIGVDALPEYAPAWKRDRPDSRFFSYLVTDHSGVEATFFRSPATGLSSTDREMASGRFFGAEMDPAEIRVEAITLNDLLDREGVTQIDLVSIDIEGHELTALAGFDIERFRPQLVVIEISVLDANGTSGDAYRYFERHGYAAIEAYRKFDAGNVYFEPKNSK
jgi:FkbM family methyltransferase